jgi:hypothetical protein
MAARKRSWRGVRTMTAQRASTCPICRETIEIGQQISSHDRGPWQHIAHMISAIGGRPGMIRKAAAGDGDGGQHDGAHTTRDA